MRIGIFGGTFNPIHAGHLRAAAEVCEAMALDRIMFMPSGMPPLKDEELEGAEHRFAMTELAVAGDPRFCVTDLEIGNAEKSYTVMSLDALLKRHPGDDLFFVVGLDAFLDLPNWRAPEQIMALMDLVVVLRPGYTPASVASSPFLATPCRFKPNAAPGTVMSCRLTSGRTAHIVAIRGLDISSTMIRRLVREVKRIDHLVPGPVAAYIVSNRLYRRNNSK